VNPSSKKVFKNFKSSFHFFYIIAATFLSSCTSFLGFSFTKPYELKKATFADLQNFHEDNFEEALQAFKLSCEGFDKLPKEKEILGGVYAKSFQEVCKKTENYASAKAFFMAYFTPYLVTDKNANSEGIITGYYEYELKGSLTRKNNYIYPVRALPENINDCNFTRAEIESGALNGKGSTLFYTDSLIDKTLLQVQGSGRVLLEDGKTIHVGYAGNNGKSYKALSKILQCEGIKPQNGFNMQGMREWFKNNPEQAEYLTNQNDRYIYFRIMPADAIGPKGAFGVELISKRAIAIDNTIFGLGFPVWLETSNPKGAPINRLVMAQDTGAAIRGAVRADFFWGSGSEAENMAGKMKRPGKYYFLIPKEE